MKRYTLKKWYPSLPKDVTIGCIITYYDVVEQYSDHQSNLDAYINLHPEEVENNPEYWEELIDFEILLWIDQLKLSKYRKDTQIKNTFTSDGHQVYKTEQLQEMGCTPYLVRRKSDGEEFIIGQEVILKDRNCVPMQITEMILNESDLMIMAHNKDDRRKFDKDIVFGCGARINQIEPYINRSEKILSIGMIEEAWMKGEDHSRIEDIRNSNLYKRIIEQIIY